MKAKTRLLTGIIFISLAITACIGSAPTPAEPEEFMMPLDGENPMAIVEAIATGTAQALTQLASGSAEAATQTAIATRGPAVLMVILPDGARMIFSYQELESLSLRTADLFDKPRPVVELDQLVDRSNWDQGAFYSVTFEGLGSLTLRFDQANNVALYLDEGTVNFFSGYIPVDDWPREIVLVVFR